MLFGALALVALIAIAQLIPLYTDWLWFQEVGYSQVFLTMLALRGGLFLFVSIGFLTFLYGNLSFATRTAAPDVYWEVHCRAQFPIPRERVTDLLAEVNGKAWLVKACESALSEKGAVGVWLSYAFNLAGGVTPNHLKSQIFEWIESVRQLWFEWRRPVAPRTEAEGRAAETVH